MSLPFSEASKSDSSSSSGASNILPAKDDISTTDSAQIAAGALNDPSTSAEADDGDAPEVSISRKSSSVGRNFSAENFQSLLDTAKAGNADAVQLNALGDCYRFGRGPTVDVVEANSYYLKAEQKKFPVAGMSDAFCSRAEFAREGVIGTADAKSAYKLFIDSSKLSGSYRARLALAQIRLSGWPDAEVPKDIGKALGYSATAANFLREKIESASTDEAHHLEKQLKKTLKLTGELYVQVVPRDPSVPQWNVKTRSWHCMAYLFSHGVGVSIDTDASAKWLALGAEAADPDSLIELGNHYCFGLGVDQDFGKALELYEKAGPKGKEYISSCKDAEARANEGCNCTVV